MKGGSCWGCGPSINAIQTLQGPRPQFPYLYTHRPSLARNSHSHGHRGGLSLQGTEQKPPGKMGLAAPPQPH